MTTTFLERDNKIDWSSLKPLGRTKLPMGDLMADRREDPLSLLDKDVEVGVFDTTAHRIYSVLFADTVLFGQGMISLLRESRPSRNRSGGGSEDDREAILADWQIMDKISECAIVSTLLGEFYHNSEGNSSKIISQ